DDVHSTADEVGGQCGEPIKVTLCPAGLYRHILSFDIARFAQPPIKRGEKQLIGRGAAEESDYRQRLLLRVQRASRGHRAAQQNQQLAAVHHSMSSSTRARTGCGVRSCEPHSVSLSATGIVDGPPGVIDDAMCG